jgi:hypothetical protein
MQFTTSNIIAASQLVAVAFGAPLLQSSAPEARSLAERGAYKVYGGDGSAAQGWPKQSDWTSYDAMWKANEGTMSKSCSQFQQKDNSPAEIADIKKAISQVAKETNLKDVFLLAIIMQESKGCVRAPTTSYGFSNPGIMQSFQGKNSCFNVNPCPSDKIVGMIRDGAGVGLGAGLQQSLKQAGGSDAQTYYKAARVYNSGSVAAGGNLGAGIATHCYSSDIANRLMGWEDSKPHGCVEASVMTMGGSSSSTPASSTPAPATGNASTGSASSGSSSAPSGTKAPGASSTCKKWYTVKAGDSCSSTGISLDQLVKLNTSLKKDCTNLDASVSYCVGN